MQLLLATFLLGPLFQLEGIAVASDLPPAAVGMLACILEVVLHFSWRVIPWLYQVEIFAAAERERALSLVLLFRYVAIGTLELHSFLTSSQTMFAFGGVIALNLLIVLRWVKETKWIPLDLIPHVFNERLVLQVT